MLSAFAQRLSPVLRRRHVLPPHTFFISKVTAASQSRSFISTPPAKEDPTPLVEDPTLLVKDKPTPLAKEEYPANSHQPPKMSKDLTWTFLTEYSKKQAAPRISPEDMWRDRSNRVGPNPPPSVYAGSLSSCSQTLDSANASLGRSIVVKYGFADSLKRLTQRLRANKVYHTWRYQMRHEKKGVKRRRLKSQRWRRHFADEVCLSSCRETTPC